MNLMKRLAKVEITMKQTGIDAEFRQNLKELRFKNLISGLRKFGYDEDSARQYAELFGPNIEQYSLPELTDLMNEGMAKYGLGKFGIEDGQIVPIESGLSGMRG